MSTSTNDVLRVRALFTRRPYPCCPECPGWAVFNADTSPMLDTCDDCWGSSPIRPSLEDLLLLPEARHELALAVKVGAGYTWPRQLPPQEQCATAEMPRTASSVELLTVTKQLRDELTNITSELQARGWARQGPIAQRNNDPERIARLLSALSEANAYIAMYEEEPPPAPDFGRDEPIFRAVLDAMDRAEGIDGPEGDDYRRLMLAIETEARARRNVYLKKE